MVKDKSDNLSFAWTLFIGRTARLALLKTLDREIKYKKNIRNMQEAKDLMNDIIDSERASIYLYKNPTKIVIP